MALTTLAEVKQFLGVGTTAFDLRLDAMRGAAERLVERWCKRKFAAADRTEYLSGNGTRFVPLSQRPVNSVTKVSLATRGSYGQGVDSTYVDLLFGVDWALKLEDDPLAQSGVLVKLNGTWPEHPGFARNGVLSWEKEMGLGNIKVVYNAGYPTCPDDVKYAVALIVGYMQRTARRGGQDYSERLGDHSYMIPMARIREAPDLGEARQILSTYREVGW